MRILGKCTDFELDHKHFYLPGVRLSDECPNCGKTTEINLAEDCLSYPRIGEPTPVYFRCGCGQEWETAVEIFLNVTIKDAS